MSSQRNLSGHWLLQPDLDFLNHGSFGACPTAVLETQSRMRAELEAQPCDFFIRQYESELDAAREKLATFLGAAPEGLVAVPNATSGVNTVLRSLEFQKHDELVVTDHVYNACRNAVDFVSERWEAKTVVASVPFPIQDPQEVLDSVLACVTERTVLALVDHVTSPTALVLPIKAIVDSLTERGVDTLVDGAHAPGMIDLDIDDLGAAYYVGNCHKWMCTPKGAGFLSVRTDRRDKIRPLTISHGANTHRAGRSRFHDEFDWTGTMDPTPFLCVPFAIDFLESLVDGGWPEIRRRNRALALQARKILTSALGIDAPCPQNMIGSMVSFPLEDGRPNELPNQDPLQLSLLREHQIEVPVFTWPKSPKRVLRVSAQLYNSVEHYRHLAEVLRG